MCFKKSLTYFGVQVLCSQERLSSCVWLPTFRFVYFVTQKTRHWNQIFIEQRVQEVHCCAEHDERSHSRKTTNFCPKCVWVVMNGVSPVAAAYGIIDKHSSREKKVCRMQKQAKNDSCLHVYQFVAKTFSLTGATFFLRGFLQVLIGEVCKPSDF